MEAVCKELDETKAAMAKLMEEYKAKSSLAESLKTAHDGQLAKIREMKQQIENQAEELRVKSMEIKDSRKLYEELSSSFHEKEVSLRQLNSTFEHLRESYSEKLRKCEEEKKELISALDGATAKSDDQEQKILLFKKEIEDLKGALSISQMKCSDAVGKTQTMVTAMKQMELDIESKNACLLEQSENKTKCDILKIKLAEMEADLAKESSQRIAVQNTLNELKQRDGVLHKYEEENSNLKEQLKWKKEQFLHLEEAHKKLQDEFRDKTCEWQAEKNELLDEVGKLQNDIDSQTRMLDDTKSRLQMCHQALAHEESRRKLLEIKVNESQVGYENIAAEFQEARSMIESLTMNRDEEIAGLRGSLTAKETLLKEMEHKLVHLEQENQELQGMVNDLQKSQIAEARMSGSVSKLQQKFKALEQIHKECSKILEKKESEWSLKVDKLVAHLDECQADLQGRNNQARDLQLELENCHSLLSGLLSQNEEFSVILLVVRSGVLQTQSELDASRLQIEHYVRKKEQEISNLKELVEEKERELDNILSEMENARANTDTLLMRIESLDALEQQSCTLKKELQQHKEMLDESLNHQSHLKEQAMQKENSMKQDLDKAADELEKAHIELADKARRELEMDYELQRWKSVAERLTVAQAETEDHRQTYQALFQRQERETEVLVHNIEARFKQEKEKYLQIIESKNLELEQLKEKVPLLEQRYEDAINVSLREKQFKVEKLTTELLNSQVIIDKLSAIHILDQLDVEMKDSWIMELEEQTGNLREDLESQKRSHAVHHKQCELLKEKLESVESFEYKWKGILEQMEERNKSLMQKLESEQRSSFELKEQVQALELEKLHAGEMLSVPKERVDQLNARLRAMEFTMNENSNIISKQREEIDDLLVKLQLEGSSSSELKQQIQLLQDELNQKLNAEEVMIASHQEQLLQFDAKLRSMESNKSMDKDLIRKLEKQTEDLQLKLVQEESFSIKLRERIQVLEDELDQKLQAEHEVLSLQQQQIEQANAKLRSMEDSKSELSRINDNLEEEIKGLKQELVSKEALSSELKERELLEGESDTKLHAEEERQAFLQEENNLLNSKVQSMETANNELNNVILKLKADLRLATETSQTQAIQLRNFQEELTNLNDTIRALSDDRDEMKRRMVFFTKLPNQIDKVLCQDLNLLNSFQCIMEGLAINGDEKDEIEPLASVCEPFSDIQEQAVAVLIRLPLTNTVRLGIYMNR
ncbi:Uncharacterized protein EJ110_NYTH45260 [Nymphaea thermarum]|nr:Uncharacterized protein EJ110_NYTH45260 [Nymphaea thermarum]